MYQFIKNTYIKIQQSLISIFVESVTIDRLVFPSDKILIIAPHPDDEIIGLGGILLSALDSNVMIKIIYLTDGECSGASSNLQLIRENRITLRNSILSEIGFDLKQIISFSLPDGAIPEYGSDNFIQVREKLINLINDYNPTQVFVTHPIDYWPNDHVNAAVLVKDIWNSTGRKFQLYYYWVWAWYNMRPCRWKLLRFDRLRKVDIKHYLAMKNQLIDAYLGPKSPKGIPWSGILPSAMIASHRNRYEIIECINC